MLFCAVVSLIGGTNIVQFSFKSIPRTKKVCVFIHLFSKALFGAACRGEKYFSLWGVLVVVLLLDEP
jgi:hypothetical protein